MRIKHDDNFRVVYTVCEMCIDTKLIMCNTSTHTNRDNEKKTSLYAYMFAYQCSTFVTQTISIFYLNTMKKNVDLYCVT